MFPSEHHFLPFTHFSFHNVFLDFFELYKKNIYLLHQSQNTCASCLKLVSYLDKLHLPVIITHIFLKYILTTCGYKEWNKKSKKSKILYSNSFLASCLIRVCLSVCQSVCLSVCLSSFIYGLCCVLACLFAYTCVCHSMCFESVREILD